MSARVLALLALLVLAARPALAGSVCVSSNGVTESREGGGDGIQDEGAARLASLLCEADTGGLVSRVDVRVSPGLTRIDIYTLQVALVARPAEFRKLAESLTNLRLSPVEGNAVKVVFFPVRLDGGRVLATATRTPDGVLRIGR